MTELSTIANIATALTVLTGVIFGLVEMRRARRDRAERAAFAVVRALMSPEWMTSAVLVHAIREGATAEEIEGDPRVCEAAQKIGIILEAVGYSVFARMIPLQVVDDMIGGTVRVAWKKLRPFIEFERQRAGNQKSWEWFEWLAQQTDRHSMSKTSLSVGAPVIYKNWTP